MKKNLIIYCGLLSLFGLFFLQFPLQHSLTGNLDTIANLGMYKQMKLAIDGLFIDSYAGSFCYPSENTWIHMGADFGIGIIHVFFNYLGFSDLWANYIFISLLFSFNAISLFALLRRLKINHTQAILTSLIYNFSHFTLANLENPNTLIFFFSFTSLFFLIRYFNSSHNKKFLYLSILIGGIQIYFSPYNFFLHSIIWGVFYFFYEKKKPSKVSIFNFCLAISLHAILIFPYLYIFIFRQGLEESYNIIKEKDIAYALALHINDYWRVLPNHIYLKSPILFNDPWVSNLKSAFLGVTFYLCVLMGVFNSKERRLLWLFTFFIGLILATGPYLTYNFEKIIPSLMFPLYEYLHFDNIFRIPSKGFFIALLPLAYFAGSGLMYFWNKSKYLGLVILSILLLENVPLKMNAYDHRMVLHPDQEMIDHLENANPSTVLDLPSSLFQYWDDRREYIYVYWQHFHRNDILNGNLGFVTPDRMNTYHSLLNYKEEDITSLCADYGVNSIVYHKDLVLNEEELKLADDLKQNTNLELVLETSRSIIFNVRNISNEY